MYRIEGRIQPYSWGGKTFLPGLLNKKNEEDLPHAEYWLGIHPSAPALVHLGQGATTTLTSLVNSDKKRHLGEQIRKEFNSLPFLLKVLDVNDMLSIQVHPNKADAVKGFQKENMLGTPLDSPQRNYKDANHKPEVMIALSEFWLLHGFASDIELRLQQYHFLTPFSKIFHEQGIGGLYKHLMELSQEDTEQILLAHLTLISDQYQKDSLDKSTPDYWAAKAYLNEKGKIDRGIFSIYLFNILRLYPGEGIFQGARMPHAYLEGQNIELMANSDNVLRAGLTPKHIDIPELLENIDFVETIPNILSGNLNKGWLEYPCPVRDFSIASMNVNAGQTIECSISEPSILLQLTGNGEWKGLQENSSKGLNAFFIEPGEEIEFKASSDTLLFLASVPA